MSADVVMGSILDTALLPIGIGCVVGTIVLTIISVLRRKRLRRPDLKITPPAGEWDGPDSFANRRSSVRREGPSVKILATSTSLKNTELGYVLDRSTGGLRLAFAVPVPAGSTMQVRAKNAPESTPWVTVIVRSCRPVGTHQELGCEFKETPPWNVLLLFG